MEIALMTSPSLTSMQAVVLDAFGGVETLQVREVERPRPAPGQVLIRVEAAGVGSWDAEEREGGYDGAFGFPSRFPYILGWDGAGVVESVGLGVLNFQAGDRVIAATMPLPHGGFYAQYAVVAEENVAIMPANLSIEQAGALPWDGLTAQSGLDTLSVGVGQRIMIIGASGGIGHMAVQLAKSRGAFVLAIASGDDGVDLCRQLGANMAVDGRRVDVVAAAHEFAPIGLDAVLTLVGGDSIERVLRALGSVPVAAPFGVNPEPKSGSVRMFNGERGNKALGRLTASVSAKELTVHVSDIFSLGRAAEAHNRLKRHYIGKIAIRI
jgi:NADPH:quinone reductase